MTSCFSTRLFASESTHTGPVWTGQDGSEKSKRTDGRSEMATETDVGTFVVRTSCFDLLFDSQPDCGSHVARHTGVYHRASINVRLSSKPTRAKPKRPDRGRRGPPASCETRSRGGRNTRRGRAVFLGLYDQRLGWNYTDWPTELEQGSTVQTNDEMRPHVSYVSCCSWRTNGRA